MDEKDLFTGLKEKFQEEVIKAYQKGVDEGAVSAAAVIYSLLNTMGLNDDNILFEILKDLAATHGCDNLAQYVVEMRENAEKKKAESNSSELPC